MAFVNAACAGRVTISTTGGKFCPVSNFMLLHTHTLAACSYVLLLSAFLEWSRNHNVLSLQWNLYNADTIGAI